VVVLGGPRVGSIGSQSVHVNQLMTYPLNKLFSINFI
jgi:hypothetical protein